MSRIRVYADTSVFGGGYYPEFQTKSQAFFEEVKKQHFVLVTSAIIQKEIAKAPQRVQDFFGELLHLAEVIDISEEALLLQEAYLNANIVSRKSANDALHVALATVSKCLLIVSWNFKHIVHFQKIPLYNAVNSVNGYHPINIFSPAEVINYGEP